MESKNTMAGDTLDALLNNSFTTRSERSEIDELVIMELVYNFFGFGDIYGPYSETWPKGKNGRWSSGGGNGSSATEGAFNNSGDSEGHNKNDVIEKGKNLYNDIDERRHREEMILFEAERRTREIVEEAADVMIGVSNRYYNSSVKKKRTQKRPKNIQDFKINGRNDMTGQKNSATIKRSMYEQQLPEAWINNNNSSATGDLSPSSESKQLVFDVLNEDIFHLEPDSATISSNVDIIGDCVMREWGVHNIIRTSHYLASPVMNFDAIGGK